MAAKKNSDSETTEPTSNSFHDELQNTDAKSHTDGVTKAPVHNDVPQAPGFKAPKD